MNRKHSLFWLLPCLLVLPFLQACQDDEELPEDNKKAVIPAAGSTEDYTLDSVYFYAKEIYLWNTALPEYAKFNPRKYTTFSSEEENLQQELFDISQLQLNPATGRPYEYMGNADNSAKYSYFTDKDDPSSGGRGSVASFLDSDTYFDFGFGLSAYAADDIRFRFVYPNSPAAALGLVRGDRLRKVNGRTVRADSRSDVDFINNALTDNSISVTVEKANGTTKTFDIIAQSYQINPVLKTSLFNLSNKKVGYLVYDSFTRISNSEAKLNEAFENFAAAGVTDLVIDLRYNGGGYVRTAQHLLDLIGPSRLHGSVMYSELYNELMQNGEADILKYQPLLDENGQQQEVNGKKATYADLDYSESGNTYKFYKKGSLDNIENICFIVGEGTASASELVINALKPYVNVTVIGQKTYGKPVGFFGINISRYKFYMPNFKTINSLGEGEYFEGIEPDIKAFDDVRYDFGNPKEESLEMALTFIETGSMVPNGRISSQEGARSSAGSLFIIGHDHSFKGMVEDRINLAK